MFNVVDLLPQDTFRYCLNAYKGITTINERQVSQMVDDITSYIETNYAGDLNDNGAWDDPDVPSGEMAESSASEVEIEPNENEKKLLKTLDQYIDNTYNSSDGVKNYKNLFMYIINFFLNACMIVDVDFENHIFQKYLRYVITYIILCHYAGPTLVFMLDVKVKVKEVKFELSDDWVKALGVVKQILDDVLQNDQWDDDEFDSYLDINVRILVDMLNNASSDEKTSDGFGGGKDNTTHKSRNITHQNDISKSSDQYSNAIIKMSGGSCQNITYFNPLLSVKCSYEWSHDFSSGRAQKYVMNDKSFYYNDGIFEIVKKGWNDLTDNPDNLLNASVSDGSSTSVSSGTIATVSELFDKELFLKLKSKPHKEENYLSTIIDTMLSENDCGDVTEKFMYIPIVRFSIETDDRDRDFSEKFKNSINQYFDGQRMFTKLGDDQYKYHLYVTSDNTPTANVTNSSIGNYLEDMGVDNLEIALGISRSSLYTLWEGYGNNDARFADMFNFNKGNTYYIEMKDIIDNIKTNNKQIVSPARIIDPITPNSGAKLVPAPPTASVSSASDETAATVSSESDETAATVSSPVAPPVGEGVASAPDEITAPVSSAETATATQVVPPNYQQISNATLYGINKLLGLWINAEKIIENFDMIPSQDGKYKGIKFISYPLPKDDDPTTFVPKDFNWQVGDSTVNSVCQALITAKKKTTNDVSSVSDFFTTLFTNETDSRNIRLFTIVNFIMTHPKFRFNNKLINTNAIKQYFYTILSFLKSCGDEYQRLTCESINKQDILAFLLTKDRILVAESIEKYTPTYSCLQSPTTNIYLDQADEFELFYNKYKADITSETKKNEIRKKNTGIISNRGDALKEGVQVDLPTVYNNLITEINTKLYKNPNLVPAQVPVQPDKIPKLKKIVVALSYYMLTENYENIIECEVGKALSQTINPDLLKNISIKNTCITSDNLLNRISSMFDEPNIIDQFIKSYGIAVESFIQKLETYIKIIQDNRVLMDSLFPALNAPTPQLSTELTVAAALLRFSRTTNHLSVNVELMYRYYIEKLEAMPQKFSDKIKNILEDTIKLEESRRRSSRATQTVVPSGSDAVPEFENELAHLQREIDKLDKKIQTSQATQVDASTTSMVGKIASATKKFFNSLKKEKTTIQKKMQSLMKKIEESEIRFAKSVKRITVETYRNTLSSLFLSPSTSSFSRTGGRKITRKLYKNKNKKKSKQRHYNYARKQSIKNKNKYIHKFIKTKKVKI